jgi:hypothetical protein
LRHERLSVLLLLAAFCWSKCAFQSRANSGTMVLKKNILYKYLFL